MDRNNASQSCGYIDAAPFRDGIRERRLLLQFCADTRQFQHPPRPVSVFTGRRNLVWREVCGRGRVYSYTRMANPSAPSTQMLLATVALDEGVHIVGRLMTDGSVGDFKIDSRVQLAWDDVPAGNFYPVFSLLDDPAEK